MTLREAAERATPGPWTEHDPRMVNDAHGNALFMVNLAMSAKQAAANAAYIAAADPTTVLALLADRDRLQRERERAELERDTQRDITDRECARADRLQRELDEAVEWIRVVGEEMIGAGYKSGDRTVTIASLRAALALVTKLRAALRRHAVSSGAGPGPSSCWECATDWPVGEPERHAPECLATDHDG